MDGYLATFWDIWLCTRWLQVVRGRRRRATTIEKYQNVPPCNTNQCAGLCHTGIPALTANWAEFFKNCVKGVSPIAYVAMKICQLLWFINALKTYEFSSSTIVIACNFRKSTSKININLNSNWGKTLTFLRIGFKPAIITTARSQRSNIPYGAFTFLKRSHHMKWLVNHLVTHKKFCYMLHRSYISQEEHNQSMRCLLPGNRFIFK